MDTKKFRGSITAMITPFVNGQEDNIVFSQKAYSDFINWQIESGVHGLVSCGTTGESFSFSFEEFTEIVGVFIESVKGRVSTIVGCGSNDTHETIAKTLVAQKAGADAALIVTPYYNKPSQAGLYQHFSAIHQNTSIPIILYNVPGRTCLDMSDKFIASLINEFPRIIGVKEASGNIHRVVNLRKLITKNACLLSGDDATAAAFNFYGGDGCISVTSNVAPKKCFEMQNACLNRDFETAAKINHELYDLNQVMFIESNPVPAKYAVSKILAYIEEKYRSPLYKASAENKLAIDACLADLKLI